MSQARCSNCHQRHPKDDTRLVAGRTNESAIAAGRSGYGRAPRRCVRRICRGCTVRRFESGRMSSFGLVNWKSAALQFGLTDIEEG